MTDIHAKLEAARQLLAVASDIMAELFDELERFEDVNDGDEGRPQPNWAMRARANIERTLDKIEEASK